MGVVLRQAE